MSPLLSPTACTVGLGTRMEDGTEAERKGGKENGSFPPGTLNFGER